ncbi:class D sortase [Aquibacillus salsiterrae]|uniref:Class D sortase n=1 Tax=Aquibacillus salsiterrae TaxID=2950439 RepID=A0A9X4AG74_9BACI|nr:sortase [Aquibacillus salsiterrae]MDC3416980.1 class D sortase [Aquibacillus salsiterrae]
MMKKLAILFILAGVIVMAYPAYNYYSSVSDEKQLLEAFEQIDQEGASSNETTKSYKELNEVFNRRVSAEESNEEEADQSEPSQEVEEQSESNSKPEAELENLLGVITIDKINVELPILEGASLKNLDKGAGHLKGTASLGQVGNSAVAAHRSWTYGRQFNRLNEVEVGDEIKIKTKGKEYTYVVFKIKIVKPEDISVLNPIGDKKVLTLITCTPIKEATDRLIVHAELKA